MKSTIKSLYQKSKIIYFICMAIGMYKKIIGVALLGISIFWINSVKADASNVYLNLCEWTQDKFVIDAGTKKEICFNLQNSSKENYEIIYGFTDAHLDDNGTQICGVSPSADSKFAQLFQNPEVKTIKLDASTGKIIKETIVVPVGVVWTVYGCLHYTVKGSVNQTAWSMLWVQIARFLPLKIFIGKTADIKSEIAINEVISDHYTTDKRIGISIDDENAMNIKFLVENKWNIEEDIQITGKVYNIFWFEKVFTIVPTKLGVGGKVQLVANLGIVPFYKWLFTVKFNVTNTPIFMFNIDTIDKKYTKSTSISSKVTIYIYSWIHIVVVLIGVRLIIKILPFKIRRKKSSISQVPPTSVG